MTLHRSLDDVAAMLSDGALAALRAGPDFRAVVEELIAESLDNYQTFDAAGCWMTADVGRMALYVAALLLDAQPGGLTVAALNTSAQSYDASSRGRVAQFIRFAQDAGEITVPAGPEPWTQRRLGLRAVFVERLQRRAINEARVISRLAPEIAPLAASLEDDATYRRFLLWSAVLATRERMVGPTTPVTMFLQRQSGMRILYHLTLDQPPGRERLLEDAALSRNQLSKLYRVSRAHINRLLADAEADGLLSCPRPNRVVFSAALSDDFERTMAFIIQMNRAAFVATALEATPSDQASIAPSPALNLSSSAGLPA